MRSPQVPMGRNRVAKKRVGGPLAQSWVRSTADSCQHAGSRLTLEMLDQKSRREWSRGRIPFLLWPQRLRGGTRRITQVEGVSRLPTLVHHLQDCQGACHRLDGTHAYSKLYAWTSPGGKGQGQNTGGTRVPAQDPGNLPRWD